MAASSDLPRFDIIADDDLEEFITSTDSENTKKQIKYGLSIFNEYCRHIDVNYEDLDNSELDKLLARFYAGARSKQGTEYSAKTMHCVRFGLQRHFQSSKGIDIKGKDFPLSLRTFKATLTKLKAKGKASVKHYPQSATRI